MRPQRRFCRGDDGLLAINQRAVAIKDNQPHIKPR
jgi:hypothetical protein